MAEEEASGTLRMVHAFGARSSVPRLGNLEDRSSLPKPLHFVEDTNTLMYTVGRRVVVHNLDTNTMRFIPENDRLEANLALTVSPNQKYAAIVEKVHPESSGQKAVPFTQVATYNLHSSNLKMVKKLISSEISLKEWKGVCFSADSHLLAVQSGPPDWLIVIWNWSSPTPKQVPGSPNPIHYSYGTTAA